jgi:hypothetical protein
MAVSNTSKTSAATFANLDKNTGTIGRYVKAGQGWNYDDPSITYDGATDPITGLPVYYDGLGTAPSFTNQTKHDA